MPIPGFGRSLQPDPFNSLNSINTNSNPLITLKSNMENLSSTLNECNYARTGRGPDSGFADYEFSDLSNSLRNVEDTIQSLSDKPLPENAWDTLAIIREMMATYNESSDWAEGLTSKINIFVPEVNDYLLQND